MAQYSHFRRTGTNLKTAGVSPQVAWYCFATMVRDLTKQRLNQHVCKRVQVCVCMSGVLCDNNLTGRHTLNTGRKAFDAGNGFCQGCKFMLNLQMVR